MEGFTNTSTNDEKKMSGFPAKTLLVFGLISLGAGVMGGILGSQIDKNFSFLESSKNSEEMKVGPSAPNSEEKVLTNLVAKNSPGVVSIVVKKRITAVQGGFPFFFLPFEQKPETGDPQKIGSGSGFFVSEDGIIVTNKHVVQDDDAQYSVLVVGQEKELPATILAKDPVNDIAFLKVEGNNFPTLTLGDSDALEVGETAVAIGNSLGEFANSVSRGIISGKQRSLTAGSMIGAPEQLSGIIQTDAAINPGNSGGPLFNLRGEVIGVNVAVAQGAENIGFALPINQIKIRLSQLQKNGKISVPFMGVRYIILNESLQKTHDLPYAYGALVLRGKELTDFAVIPGSPADRAGIRENDILLTIDGKKITSDNTIAEILSKKMPGEKVTFDVWSASSGERKGVTVTLEERKAE